MKKPKLKKKKKKKEIEPKKWNWMKKKIKLCNLRSSTGSKVWLFEEAKVGNF